MEWIEITAPTVEEAKERALEHLGIASDEAEFEVLSEPSKGLFGKVRGEARVRARVAPKGPRPKTERRDRRKKPKDAAPAASASTTDDEESPMADAQSDSAAAEAAGEAPARRRSTRWDDAPAGDIEQQRADAEAFVTGVLAAAGLSGQCTTTIVDGDIEVDVQGDDLGLLIGPRGQVLLALQDLARVAVGRSVDGRPARLRVDVASYWHKRHEALGRFAVKVAGEVQASGVARALEPMSAADRKVVHDAVGGVDGVTTRSEGEDPHRRVVIAPA